ncbi:hypothetical protein KEM55_001512 [Ascosphaera atra]|nr:hypothetical protein KEM55_001512 [Ascosphaera atra]
MDCLGLIRQYKSAYHSERISNFISADDGCFHPCSSQVPPLQYLQEVLKPAKAAPRRERPAEPVSHQESLTSPRPAEAASEQSDALDREVIAYLRAATARENAQEECFERASGALEQAAASMPAQTEASNRIALAVEEVVRIRRGRQY